MIILAIAVALFSMIFTVFCGLKYVHPGSHRGYADDVTNVSWKQTIKNKWWEFRDVPVVVRNPIAYVIRFWWWMASGTNLKEWAAIHRHNSIHETKLWPAGKTDKGRLTRAGMYSAFSKNKDLVDLYGIEVPDTWVDKNIFYKFPLFGPVLLLVLFYIMLGAWCIIPWCAQMAWMPFWRSEAVNGWDPKEHEWNRLFHSIKDRKYCR